MPVNAAQTIADPFSWDAAKVIIDYQSTLIYYALAVLGIVTFVWWLVNWARVTVGLKKAVRSAKSEAKDSVDAAIVKFDNKMSAELSVQKKEFVGLKEMIVEQGAVSALETARLLAVTSYNQKWFETAAFWWLCVIVRGVELREVAKNVEFKEAMLLTATERTLECLNSLDNLDVLSDEDVKEMREDIEKIPPLLDEKKQQIKNKITELTKKEPTLSQKKKIS